MSKGSPIITLRVPPKLAPLLERRYGTRPRTTTIWDIIKRYDRLMAKNKPRLTENEWKVLLDVLGQGTAPEAHHIEVLYGKVWEQVIRRRLTQKWDCSRDSLQEKLEGYDELQWMAILDACEQFWEGDEENPPVPW
jgi:hypothetical protein